MNQMLDTIPVVETERLILRAPTLADLAPLTAFYTTERSKMVGGPRDAYSSFLILAARIGHWGLYGYGMWHIDNRETGAFLGSVGFGYPPDWQEPELGWSLVSDAEGKGYALEAARAARRFGAQHFNLNGVISYIRPENTRSIALATRLGATRESESVVHGISCHIWRHPKEET